MKPFSATAALAQLKDFQRRTVDYVFQRLYLDQAHTRRFLIADEVGLGKTLVARGVIAKAIEHLSRRQRRVSIVYVCSNGDIARQNARRLNVSEDNCFQMATRITLLPMQIRHLHKQGINLLSLTPGTSFDLKRATGTVEERALLYCVLRGAWKLNTPGALRLFRVGATLESLKRQVDAQPAIDRTLAAHFLKSVRRHDDRLTAEGKTSLRKQARQLIGRFEPLGDTEWPPPDLAQKRTALIGALRSIMAQTCIDAIKPDIVILDEFQRFKTLLDHENPISDLAQRLFNYQDEKSLVRVILLSATPYKMYSMAHESGQDHHGDFLHTLEFLCEDAAHVSRTRALIKQYRDELLRSPLSPARVRNLKQQLEACLRPFIARTERLAATPDRSGMLVSKTLPGLQLRSSDLQAYVAYARLSDELQCGDMLEYWKAAPYLLNLMEGYELKERLRRRLQQAEKRSLTDLLRQLDSHLITKKEVEAYQRLDPQHARMNGLLEDTLGRNLWQLLWMPPALPYTDPEGAFAASADYSVTKRLVFSSWRVVPKAIAVVLSYEAQRRMIDAGTARSAEADGRERQFRPLRFGRSEGKPTGMSGMALVYPSISLATLPEVDPLHYFQEARRQQRRRPALHTILTKVERSIKQTYFGALQEFAGAQTGPVDQKWYWAAPILLDRLSHPEASRQWLERSDVAARWWSGGQEGETGDADGPDEESSAAWRDYVSEVRKYVAGPVQLGRMPPDLARVLALIGVASPAVVALRSFHRFLDSPGTAEVDGLTELAALRFAAGSTAHAFRSLFNLAEVTALIRNQTWRTQAHQHANLPYWRLVLEYSASGNLQAVVDEYVHILHESLGLLSEKPGAAAEQMASTMREALRIRTVSLRAEEVCFTPDPEGIELRPFHLPSRFAMRFGNDRSESEQTQVRAEQVRIAFNSPFWPFVLATTSIGQEGLDFHQYCHAVVHWNLPANPVDLEQREGRVHRYKGHAVRKNLAWVESKAIAAAETLTDPWETMFRSAQARSKCDLEPYWVSATPRARIERYVPALPFSQDAEQLEKLTRSLAAYRLVLGQSAQEDLVRVLTEHHSQKEVRRLAAELQINLEPPISKG